MPKDPGKTARGRNCQGSREPAQRDVTRGDASCERMEAVTDGVPSAGTIGNSLDHLIGSWSAEEADELDAALRELDAFDRLSFSD